MFVKAPCPDCFGANQNSPNMVTGELDNEGIVHVKCQHGHKGHVIYNAPRHRVLIRSAVSAFLDGYTNEVVSVMHAALERAYEFYVRIKFRSHGVPMETFDKAWKDVAAQSERQFGAFHLIWLLESKAALPLDKKITETRNRVIHKGHIAGRDEALEFAELTYARIKAIEDELRDRHDEDVHAELSHQVSLVKAKLPEGSVPLEMQMFTVLADDSGGAVRVDLFIQEVGAMHQSRIKGWA